MEETGRKNDQGKLRWDLFPFEEAQSIVKVLMFGADNMVKIQMNQIGRKW
jgi:hypothetical protein